MEKDQTLNERRIFLVEGLHDLIDKGDLSELELNFRLWPLEERRILANAKYKGNTALFYACEKGDKEIMEFLLTECGADPEIKGIHCVKEDGHSKHIVPPLWSAAIKNRKDLVNLLLKHGADVNGCSDSDSTAVRAACYANKTDMVKMLVESGADINKPNKFGATCLMNAIEDEELSLYLIKNGACVNAQESKRDKLTALHYAVNYQKLSSIKVLLANGADVNLRTVDGVSPILLAALLNLDSIVTYFTTANLPISTEEKIHALEILGTKCVDYIQYPAACSWWHMALDMRNDYNIPKQLLERSEMFENHQEFVTVDELESLSAATPKTIILHSLLMKQRILGSFNNPDVLLCALQYTFELYHAKRFNDAFPVLCKCYDGFLEKNCYLYDNCVVTISQLLNCVYFMEKTLRSDINAHSDEFIANLHMDVTKLFSKQVEHIELISKKSPVEIGKCKGRVLDSDRRNYIQILLLALDSLVLMVWLWDFSIPKELFQSLKCLINIDPRTYENESLLHIAAGRDRKAFTRMYEFVASIPEGFHSFAFKLLLEAGGDVHSMDNKGNRPLHSCIKSARHRELLPQLELKIRLLLDFDAHLDSLNNAGISPYKLLRSKQIDFHKQKFISLKCLAARQVANCNLDYKNEIPSTLIKFIEVHQVPIVREEPSVILFPNGSLKK